MKDSFMDSSPAGVPAGLLSSCERKCDSGASGLGAAPRGISDYRLRPVSGLVGSGVSPSRELALTVAGLEAGRVTPGFGR